MIEEFADCRRYGANMLMNVGPMGDGSVRLIDAAMLDVMGNWISYHEEAVRDARPAGILVESENNNFILKKGNCYYLFCFGLPMISNPDVAKSRMESESLYVNRFVLPEKIKSVTWLDNGTEVEFKQEGDQVAVITVPFTYGRSLVVRVAKIEC